MVVPAACWVLFGVLIGIFLALAAAFVFTGVGAVAGTDGAVGGGSEWHFMGMMRHATTSTADDTASTSASTTYTFPSFGFRALATRAAAALTASNGGGVSGGVGFGDGDELVPFGGVPGTEAEASALQAARRAHTIAAMRDAAKPAGMSKLVKWASSLAACALLGLMFPMSRWPFPLFAMGSLTVIALAVFVNYSLAVGSPAFPFVHPHSYSHIKAHGGGRRGGVHHLAQNQNHHQHQQQQSSLEQPTWGGAGGEEGGKGGAGGVVTADTRSLNSWGCEEVTLWLKSEAGEWAVEYREEMCRQGVGANVLLDMKDANLRADLGVTSRAHRRLLLAAAGKLRDTVAETTLNSGAKVWIGRLGGGTHSSSEDSVGGELERVSVSGLYEQTVRGGVGEKSKSANGRGGGGGGAAGGGGGGRGGRGGGGGGRGGRGGGGRGRGER
jgi:hypothetical protein